eukprot:m.115317 g.115317  ORF g.115317 m.115317 type:complete len:213 (-) comp28412_c0_seq2:235-873(-)
MNAPVAPPRMSLLGYNNSGNRKSDPSPKKYQPALYEYCDPQELLNGNIAEEEENAYSCPTLISTQQDEIYEDFGLASKNESFVPANTFQGQFDNAKTEAKNKLIKIAASCDIKVTESKDSKGTVGCAKSRVEAENAIREAGGEKGLFLFRESKGLMVLSLSDGDIVHHLKVEEKGANVPAQKFGESEFKAFLRYYGKQCDKLPVLLQRLLLC